MCCGSKNGPKWKREKVKDHKFDYIDINEFYDPSFFARISYIYMYILILKTILVYVADLWTAVSLLVIGNTGAASEAAIQPEVSKWIFLGAISISFILLFWDIRKARDIMATRDISYTFTSVIANRCYSLKNYRYFCLFRQINNSRKSIDAYAFFVFFTLKGWKRLLLAEAPRQVINIVTLTTLLPNWIKINNGITLTNSALGKSTIEQLMTVTMAFSTFIFTISFISVVIAAVIYVPLLCHIRGNLKEYCCHKVDKRIEDILKKQARERIENNKKAQHNPKKSKKNDIEMQALPQPTLPNIGILHSPSPKLGPNQLHMNGHHQHNYSNSPYYQQSPYDHPPMRSNFSRRNSLSSISSDQIGLTTHAQGQPRSIPYQHTNMNNSHASLSYNNNFISPQPSNNNQQYHNYY
ncbi:hypothetical protein BDB01DRAFT_323668 [Pilobolus umbonatus]|nr:hypothetical protein BDB01DRAFT_323668 [Pilobolus umbonatus]